MDSNLCEKFEISFLYQGFITISFPKKDLNAVHFFYLLEVCNLNFKSLQYNEENKIMLLK